jgi:type VI secretion system protein ImpC
MAYRVRSPRVRIAYDVERAGMIEMCELPFVIGVLGDFVGHPQEPLPPIRQRTFVPIELDGFDQVLARMEPGLDLCLPSGSCALRFRCLGDFGPEQVVRQIPALAQLADARAALADLRAKLHRHQRVEGMLRQVRQSEATQQELAAALGVREDGANEGQRSLQTSGFLQRILAEGLRVRDDERAARARRLIACFLEQVVGGHLAPEHGTDEALTRRIRELDALISAQLRAVMHAPEFQRLEASWRGLHDLVTSVDGTAVVVQVLSATADELRRDLADAADVETSGLFAAVWERQAFVQGGQMIGALIADYEFAHSDADMLLVEGLARLAAVAHAPLVGAASPELFGLDSFVDITRPRDLAMIFQGAEYRRWRAFRESDDARHVALCMPRTLVRQPYGQGGLATRSFALQELSDPVDQTQYLWGNTAYRFGTRLASAFLTHGWCAAIRGVERGGLVTGLPVHAFRATTGEVACVGPTEVALSDRRLKELIHLGFIPLGACLKTDRAAFFAAPSARRSPRGDTDEVRLAEHMGDQLPYVFAVSRFAHHLQAIVRDKPPMSREDCQEYLVTWISQYVLLDDRANEELQARLPLREALIVLTEPTRGRLVAELSIRPGFQLEAPPIGLRVTVRLPVSTVSPEAA